MSTPDLVGANVSSRYQIVSLLGEGGMGAVYEATHLALGKRVVIKTLRGEHNNDPRFRARFVQEARATSSIEHANIVKVHDVGVHDERHLYYVMEYLEGEDLSDTLLREGRLAWPRVRRIGLHLCAGLAAAHAKRIVHRDLKPSNCFRISFGEDEDFIKILDFGLAKIVESASSQSHRIGRIDLSKLEPIDNNRWRLTETGQVFGTMAYMSPEHLFGERVDHRTDIYATGVILYELLTGRTPFVLDDNPGQFIHSLRTDSPLPPSHYVPEANIPPGLDQLILRALAKKPRDRYASMAEMMGALMQVREGRSLRPLAQPPRPSVRPGLVEAARRRLVGAGTRLRAMTSGGVAAGLAVAGVIGAAALALPSEPSAQPPIVRPEATVLAGVAPAAPRREVPAARLEVAREEPASAPMNADGADNEAAALEALPPGPSGPLPLAKELLLNIDHCRIAADDFASIMPELLARADVPRQSHRWEIPVRVEIRGAQLKAKPQPGTRGLRRRYSVALAELIDAHVGVAEKVENCRRRVITIFF
jgi:tRNA A-37 threonylcarbamoyl transferase component Bud32